MKLVEKGVYCAGAPAGANSRTAPLSGDQLTEADIAYGRPVAL